MKKLAYPWFLFILISFQVNAQSPLGDGSDGSLTVVNGETLVLDTIRSAVTGANDAGNYVLNVSDGSIFSSNDEILIITMQDTDTNMVDNTAGEYEFNSVVASSSNQIILKNALSTSFNASSSTKHQVIKVNNFTDVTIAGTLTCSEWDGETGGILVFRLNGTLTVNGTGIVEANGNGFRGGFQYGSNHGGGQGGESFTGLGGNGGNYNSNNAQVGAGGGGAAYANNYGANGLNGGGGGGTQYVVGKGSANLGGAGGGGAGHAGSGGGAGYGTFGYGGHGYNQTGNGENGGINYSGDGGLEYTGGGGGGGGTYGSEELTRLYFGSGGGSGGRYNNQSPGLGGNGGGIVYISAKTIINDGLISSAGSDGGYRSTYTGGGGAGAAGSLLLRTNTLENNGNILAEGGTGGAAYYGGATGGDGGNGRTRLDYFAFTNSGNISPAAYQGSFVNIATLQLSNTPDAVGPYTVNAYIFDTDGNAITGATLHYRTNGGSFSTVSMSSSDGELFSANIPGQLVNTVIDYYITATDGTDNYSDPLIAPTGFYTFEIAALAPYGVLIEDLNNTSATVSWTTPNNVSNFVDYAIYRSETSGFTPSIGNRVAQNVNATSYTDNGLSDLHTYYYIVEANYNISSTAVSDFTGESAITINDTSKTTVAGYVSLENDLNFANTKVLLIPASPAAQRDSVYTDASGYFEIEVTPGIYDIFYSNESYFTYQIVDDLSIIEDLDLEESMLYYSGVEISGSISGVFDGVYSVVGDITVAQGDSLIINEGSSFRFRGNYNFYNYGYVEANGSNGNPIEFTSAPVNQVKARGQWQGIDFFNESDDNSVLNYVLVEYAVNGIYFTNAASSMSNVHVQYCSNVGITLNEEGSDATLSNIEITNCSGNGLYVYLADPNISHLNSHNNGDNGAYFYSSAHGSIQHSQFNYNGSAGFDAYYYCNIHIDSSEFIGNNGMGIDIDHSCNPRITYSRIADNYNQGASFNYNSNGWGTVIFENNIVENNLFHGILAYRYIEEASFFSDNIIRYNGYSGVYIYYYSRPNILSNTIIGNGTQGIVIDNADYNNPVIKNNVIAYNASDGIYKDNIGNPVIKQNTIFQNGGDGLDINNGSSTETITDNIIVDNSGWGVRANIAIETFNHNNVYGNQSGEITGLANLPVETWNFISTNLNGTTADIYLNISQEPLFGMSNSTDFSLNYNSLCINAGTTSEQDPDGTILDIGAIYRDQGNPHTLRASKYANQQVTLVWDEVTNDSILSYDVYYKTTASSTFVLFGNTADTTINVTGLTNNTSYDFTIQGVYSNSESGNSPIATEKPGEPHVSINPGAINLQVLTDTVDQNLIVTNVGSRDLNISMNNGNGKGFAHFDGSGDRIGIGDQPQLENLTAFTIEAWLRRTGNGHFEFAGKNFRNYSMYLSSNNNFGIYKGFGTSNNYQNWTTPYVVPANEWHHFAVAWTGNIIKFYVDGELVAQYDNAVDLAIPNNTYSFDIGRRGGEYSYYLNGDVAEVRMWNKVRSKSEIANSRYVRLSGDESGLVGYWPLSENYNDYSSYGANGSAAGNTYINQNLRNGQYNDIPFVLSNATLNLAPGNTDTIEIKFFNDGSSGTKVYKSPVYSNINDSTEIDYEIALTFGSQVPSTPVYFNPVVETGIPYTIVITDAEIDEVNVQVGDEIGVFDGSLCVGAGIFDGSFNFVITVWQEDPGDGEAGFSEGNTMSFKIYDSSSDLEATVTDVTYSTGDGTFSYGSFSSLSLQSTIYQNQEIDIPQNQFSLVSFNRLPRYTASSTIFGSMNSLQIAYNDAGNAFIPAYSINSIGDIDFRDAFYVFSSAVDTIDYLGTSVNPLEWDIEIEANKWNYVSFLGESPLAIDSAFPASIIDSIDVVQTSSGLMWVPSLAVNTIGNMQPGVGYQIALSSNTDITFNYQTSNGFKSGVSSKAILAPQYYNFTKTGIPYNIIIENPANLGSPLDIGDEIAAFDNGICVGAVVYSGSEKTVLTTWKGEPVYNLPGFTAGNSIQLKVYSVSELAEADAELDLTFDNTKTFNEGNFGHIRLKSTGGTTNLETTFFSELNIEVSPNPFSDHIYFSFNLSDKADVKLFITNNLGQKVAILSDQEFSSGKQTIYWNGYNTENIQLESGIYHYMLFIDGDLATGKIVFLK